MEEDVKCNFVCKDCVAKLPFLCAYTHLLYQESDSLGTSTSQVELQGEAQCILKEKGDYQKFVKNLFFQEDFRDKLCTCTDCDQIYQEFAPFILEFEEEFEVVEECSSDEAEKEKQAESHA